MEAKMQTQIPSALARTTPLTDQPSDGGAVRRTALAALVASVTNLAVFEAAHMLWRVPGEFSMFGLWSVLIATCLVALLAGGTAALLTRVTRRARPIFLALATLGTAISLVGPFQAMRGAIPGMPTATLSTGAAMLALHLLTGGVIAALVLPRLTDGGGSDVRNCARYYV